MRRQIGRVALAIVLLGFVALLSLAGVGLALAGLYQVLTPFWGVAGSLGAVAALCLVIAALLGAWAYRWLR